MEKKKITLKACPFCGGQPEVHSFWDKYAICCPRGCVDMGDSDTVKDAAKKWNRRGSTSKFKVTFEE